MAKNSNSSAHRREVTRNKKQINFKIQIPNSLVDVCACFAANPQKESLESFGCTQDRFEYWSLFASWSLFLVTCFLRCADSRICGHAQSPASPSARLFHAQRLPAFGAPPRQHPLSLLGTHARPKSVNLGPMALFRLVCSFWHIPYEL
jgi:hypothetical protein